MIVKVTLKYDGSAYHGWQDQKGKQNVKTVEEVVSKAVSTINKEKSGIVASGRTDKGVHALGQVFHFSNVHDIPMDRLRYALNNALPADIEVLKCEEVDDDFHARFSAVSKEYHYYLNTGSFDLFQRNYVTHFKHQLDLEIMQKAAQMFIGKHDFTAFNTTPKHIKSNQVISISKFEVIQEGDMYIFKVEGTSFLRYMVRMLVGSIVYAGCHKINLDRIQTLLENPGSSKSPYNIEPYGLYLYRVNY